MSEVCKCCKGAGKVKYLRDDNSTYIGICPDCKGTGIADPTPISLEVGTASVYSTTGELLVKYTGISDCIIRSACPACTILTTSDGNKIIINGGIVIYTANNVDDKWR